MTYCPYIGPLCLCCPWSDACPVLSCPVDNPVHYYVDKWLSTTSTLPIANKLNDINYGDIIFLISRCLGMGEGETRLRWDPPGHRLIPLSTQSPQIVEVKNTRGPEIPFLGGQLCGVMEHRIVRRGDMESEDRVLEESGEGSSRFLFMEDESGQLLSTIEFVDYGDGEG